MDEIATTTSVEPNCEVRPTVDLARMMGRHEAFSVMAGTCTASDIETIRRIREEKSYRDLGCTWAEFCAQHLRINKRSADRMIEYLDEFGPTFFQVAQMAHIGPADYRRIAPHITQEGVALDGRMIALMPENHHAASAAIEELLKRIESEEPKAIAAPFDSLLKRCRSVADTMGSLPPELDGEQKGALAEAVGAIRSAAAVLGVQ